MIRNNILVLCIFLTAIFHTSRNLSRKNDEDDLSPPQIVDSSVDLEEISELRDNITESIPTSNTFFTNHIPKNLGPQPRNGPDNLITLHNHRKCTSNKSAFIPTYNRQNNQDQSRERSSEESSDSNSDNLSESYIYNSDELSELAELFNSSELYMSDEYYNYLMNLPPCPLDSQNGSDSESNPLEVIAESHLYCDLDCSYGCGWDSESEEASSDESNTTTTYTINPGYAYSDDAEHNSGSSSENDADESSSESSSSGSDDSNDESACDDTENVNLRSRSLNWEHGEGCTQITNKSFENNEVTKKRYTHSRKPTEHKSTGPIHMPTSHKEVKHPFPHKTSTHFHHTPEVFVKHEAALRVKVLPHHLNSTTSITKETNNQHPNSTREVHVETNRKNIKSKDTDNKGNATQSTNTLRVMIKNNTGKGKVIQKEKLSHNNGFIQGFVEKTNATNEVVKGLDAKFDILPDKFQKPVSLPFVHGTGTSNREELGEAISCLPMFEWWNAEENTLETILITAENARVNWYHFSGDNQLEQLWSWDLIDAESNVDVFKLDNEYKALIVYKS